MAKPLVRQPRVLRRCLWASALIVLVGGPAVQGSEPPVTTAQAPSNAAVPAPTTVARVELDRYTGTWFEVARFANRFQRHCLGDVTATYRRRADGRLDVVNRCRTAKGSIDEAVGVARSVSPGSNAKLEVRFAPRILSLLPFVWGDYWIIDLADDYSAAVVGSPDRQYLWLLARTPAVSAETYQAMLAAAAGQGYDIDRLERTAHQ